MYAGIAAPSPPPPPPPAPSITLSSTGNPVAGTEYSVTVTATDLAGALVVTPANVTGTATFSPSTATPAPGELVKLFGATWAAAGAASIRATAPGGVVSNTLSVTVAPAPSPTPPPPPPPSPAPPAPSGGARAFSLLSGTTGTAVPFSVGFAFRKGDIAAASGVVSDHGTLQVTPKSYWPDGSLKFAVLSGTADITGGTPRVITLSAGTSSTGAALATTDLPSGIRTTGISVDCGGFGAATWTGTDFDSPFATWVSGHSMSSWVYRKAVGSDAHLVAWLEVRLFASGAVEVLPWVENGYLKVASPTNKNATYSFGLGGTVRNGGGAGQAIDLKHHQRTPLVSGAALSYWLGADPGVSVKHDTAYLMSTELVPAYWGTPAAGSALVTGLPASYTPLQPWAYNYDADSMASSGYQHAIGLLPLHDVLHLTTTADTFGAVVREGYSAGRWGIHYRDENTNRPVRFQDRPNLVIADTQGFKDNGASSTNDRTAVATGGNPPQWDVAHSPSVGYLAYLVTGRWYFMEEVQFAATANFLGNGDNAALRTGVQGLVQTAVDAWQTRSCAWDWRSKVQALTVTPDSGAGSDIRTDLINCVEANVAHFHGRYVAQANNPFGLILPGEQYNTGSGASLNDVAIWQQDFVTAAFGWSVSMDLPIGATPKSNLAAFFQWKAKSALITLGRPGVSSEWPYYNSAPYTIKIGTGMTTASWTAGTGPWPADAGAMLAATTGGAGAPTWFGTTDGVLTFEFGPTPDEACKGVFANRMPALSYAVRHNVPGAMDSYLRLVTALNWQGIENAFDGRPVWGIKPASASDPAYLAGVAVGQIGTIAGTSGAGGATIDPFCGWAFRPDTCEVAAYLSGGHHDSYDNRFVKLSLLADSPAWATQTNGSSPRDGSPSSIGAVINDVAYYSDGRPTARHTYSTLRWVGGAVKRWMALGCYGAYADMSGGGVDTLQTVDGFDPATNTWDAAGTWPNCSPDGFYGNAQEGAAGDVWAIWNPNPTKARKFGATTGAWSTPTSTNAQPGVMKFPWAWNPDGGYFFGLCWGNGEGGETGVRAVKMVSGTQTAITFNASAALTQFTADTPSYAGMDFCRDDGKFYFYDGKGSAAGRIYVVTPNAGTTWDIAIFSPTGGSVSVPASSTGGINNRFTYVRYPSGKAGIVFLPNAAANLHFLRTA